jgi:hypothetical protein
MKQSGTINNEIIRYFNSLAVDNTDENRSMMHHLPRKHIINNIMNYAKSMNVMHGIDGKTFIMLNN